MWESNYEHGRAARSPAPPAAVARLAKQVEVALGPLDLSLPQYRVLALLGDGSTASSVLARKLAVSPPTVTAVVDGLVGRGLVERQADPEDRRRLTLLLTRDGKRAARRRRRRGRGAPRRDRGVPRRAARRARRRTRPLEPRARPQPRGATGAGQVTDRDGRVRCRRHVAVRAGRRHARATRRPEPTSSPTAVGRGCERIMPVVSAHKWMFGFSLLASFLGLAVQVQIPNEVGQAIDALSQDRRTSRSSTSSPIIVVLAVDPLRAHVHVAELPAEDGVPHRVRPAEHHVRAPEPHVVLVLRPRAVGSAHLACQLRHPLGADVPHVRPEHPRAVQRGGPRVRRDALDQRAARARHDVDDAVRLHRRRADAEADVPRVVADPVTARRRRHRRRREHQRRARRQVVRGRGRAAPAPRPARRCAREWANVKDADIRAKWSPLLENLPRLGPGHRAVLRRLPRHQRAARRSGTSSPSTPTC